MMTYLLHGKPIEPDDPRWLAIQRRVSPTSNFKAPGPSADAARANAESKSELKHRALEYLTDKAGTADEIARALNVDITSIRPRLTDLKKEGKIAPSRVRRASDMGTTSGVWVIASRLKAFEEAHRGRLG